MGGYKFILFDADGTLFDFDRSEKEALCRALRLSGVEATEDMISSYNAINASLWKALERGEIERRALSVRRFEIFCDKFGLLIAPDQLAESYLSSLSQTAFLIDGAQSLLSSLLGKTKMYIITNGNERVQRGRFAISPISRFFEDIFISEAIGADKPSVAFFERVSAQIDGFLPELALVVGDSLSSDILGGNRFGVDTCWFAPTGACATEALPTYTVSELSQIIPIALGGE